MRWKRSLCPAALLVCAAVYWCAAREAHALGNLPLIGANIETVQGFGREWKSVLTFPGGLRAGWRLKDEGGAWYLASRVDRGPYRAVLGSFNIEMGSGLVCGGGGRFFHDAWKRRPPRHHVRIAPSLSLWNRQVGGALSFESHPIGASFAVFRKQPGWGNRGTPWMALAACSVRSSSCLAGAGLLARIERGNALIDVPQAGIPLVHVFSVVTMNNCFATGELDLLCGTAVGMIEAGVTSSVAGSVRLFRAPDWSDLGIWEDALRDRHEALHGAIVCIEMRRQPCRPHLALSTTVRHQEKRRVEERSYEIGFSGNRRGFLDWRFDCTVTNEVESVHPPGRMASGIGSSAFDETRIRSCFVFKGGPVTHTLKTDMTFDRWCIKPADASIGVELKIEERRVVAAFQCLTYGLRQGKPHALFRPGIGSFEHFGIAYGEGTDLSARVIFSIHPGLSLAAYCGRPWMKDARAYFSIQWRY